MKYCCPAVKGTNSHEKWIFISQSLPFICAFVPEYFVGYHHYKNNNKTSGHCSQSNEDIFTFITWNWNTEHILSVCFWRVNADISTLIVNTTGITCWNLISLKDHSVILPHFLFVIRTLSLKVSGFSKLQQPKCLYSGTKLHQPSTWWRYNSF